MIRSYLSPMPTHRSTRLVARLLLAALLLLAQHCAWVHELGHLSAARTAAGAPPAADVPHAPLELCRQCLACAQIDSATAPQSIAIASAAQVPQEPAMPAHTGTPRIDAPARRSRSPPLAA